MVQTRPTHDAACSRYRDVGNPLIVDWFREDLVGDEFAVHERPAETGIVRLPRQKDA